MKKTNIIAWLLLLVGIYFIIAYAPIVWINNADFGISYTFVRVNAINVAIGLLMIISGIGAMYRKKWKWMPIIAFIILGLWQILTLLAYAI